MPKKFWTIFASLMVVYFIATTALWFSDWSDSRYLIDDTPAPVKKKKVKRVVKVVPPALSKAALAKQYEADSKALAALKAVGAAHSVDDDMAMLMGLDSGGLSEIEKPKKRAIGSQATKTTKLEQSTNYDDDIGLLMGLEPGWNDEAGDKGKARVKTTTSTVVPAKGKVANVGLQKVAIRRVELAKALFLKESKVLNAVEWQKYDSQTYLAMVELRGRLSVLKGSQLLGVEKELARYQQKLRMGEEVVRVALAKELLERRRVKAFALGLKSFEAGVDDLSKVASWDFGAFHKNELVVAHLLAAVAKKAKRDTERESVKKLLAKVGLLKSKVAVIKKALKGLKPVKASAVDCTGLVAGSQAALDLQKRAASEAGYPLEVENSIGMRFRFIPAGKFMMGSPEREDGRDGDEKLHEVVITKPFYMSVTEVTTAEFSLRKGKGKAVVKLPFSRVEHFCLTLQAYEKAADGAYLLPTEAQWEYACRAGLSNPCYATDRDKIANFGSTFGGGVVPVAGKLANPWGLYDMLGNVKEVCRDRDESSMWGAKVPKTYIDGIKDPLSTEGDSVVARGGGWESGKSDTRAASRELFHPDTKDWSMGFRVIRVLP